jgi:hypothetical protein
MPTWTNGTTGTVAGRVGPMIGGRQPAPGARTTAPGVSANPGFLLTPAGKQAVGAATDLFTAPAETDPGFAWAGLAAALEAAANTAAHTALRSAMIVRSGVVNGSVGMLPPRAITFPVPFQGMLDAELRGELLPQVASAAARTVAECWDAYFSGFQVALQFPRLAAVAGPVAPESPCVPKRLSDGFSNQAVAMTAVGLASALERGLKPWIEQGRAQASAYVAGQKASRERYMAEWHPVINLYPFLNSDQEVKARNAGWAFPIDPDVIRNLNLDGDRVATEIRFQILQFATRFAARFNHFVRTAMITNVMGSGPNPAFNPRNPIGPVANGWMRAAAGFITGHGAFQMDGSAFVGVKRPG